AGRFLEHLGLEALALAVAQVLAQQHRGPVLCLGAARAGLDLDEARIRVGRVREHAPELEILDFRFDRPHVGFHGDERRVVVLRRGHLEQLGGVGEARLDRRDALDDRLERLLLAAERLRVLRVVPDVGGFELALDYLETRLLRVVVKGTSEARPRACGGRRSAIRVGSGARLPWRGTYSGDVFWRTRNYRRADRGVPGRTASAPASRRSGLQPVSSGSTASTTSRARATPRQSSSTSR